jgi:nitrogen PTS system EIIA component
MHISQILPVGAVWPCLQVRDKKSLLRLVASRAAQQVELEEREIYTALIEREDVGCTGMGAGVCMPHGRFASLDKLYSFFATLEEPIDFGAQDGRKVDILFVLLTPASADVEHLKALAAASKLLRDKKRCEQLRAATTAEALYQLLTTETVDDISQIGA